MYTPLNNEVDDMTLTMGLVVGVVLAGLAIAATVGVVAVIKWMKTNKQA